MIDYPHNQPTVTQMSITNSAKEKKYFIYICSH